MNGCSHKFLLYRPPVWLILRFRSLSECSKIFNFFQIFFLFITRSFQLVNQVRTILKYPFSTENVVSDRHFPLDQFGAIRFMSKSSHFKHILFKIFFFFFFFNSLFHMSHSTHNSRLRTWHREAFRVHIKTLFCSVNVREAFLLQGECYGTICRPCTICIICRRRQNVHP